MIPAPLESAQMEKSLLNISEGKFSQEKGIKIIKCHFDKQDNRSVVTSEHTAERDEGK